MQLGEVTSYNLKSQTILAEGWQELTEAQRIYIGKWERDVWPLVENINTLFEAELTDKPVQPNTTRVGYNHDRSEHSATWASSSEEQSKPNTGRVARQSSL